MLNSSYNNKSQEVTYDSYEYYNAETKPLLEKVKNSIKSDEILLNTIKRSLLEIEIRIKNKEPFFEEYLSPINKTISLRHYKEKIMSREGKDNADLINELNTNLTNLKRIERVDFYNYIKQEPKQNVKESLPKTEKDTVEYTLESYKPQENIKKPLY